MSSLKLDRDNDETDYIIFILVTDRKIMLN
jgi:hypothetical protein